MKVTKVCCQGCGADLEVDGTIRFVNCNYCGAKLEIVHDRTTTHSRVMESLEKKTGEMAEDLKVIRLQNELEKLDREWEHGVGGYMVTGRGGRKSLPSTGGSIVGGVIAIIFGVIWMGAATSAGAPGFFPLFGLLFIGVAVIGMVKSGTKANAYRNAHEGVQARRRELLEKLERAKQRIE